MGLVDRVFGGGKAGAGNAISGGYQNAIGYLNPYYNGGLEDYNNYRGEIGDIGELLDQYGNPADYIWRNAGLSPREAYEGLMEGYETSPQAEYQISQMNKAIDRGASASGMLGSGTYYDNLQRNQQKIIAEDEDRWLNNLMGVGNQQMQQLQNFQGQQADYRDRLFGLANMGYNAANTMGQYAIGQGQGDAMAELGKGSSWQDLIGHGLSFARGNNPFGNAIRKVPVVGGFF